MPPVAFRHSQRHVERIFDSLKYTFGLPCIISSQTLTTVEKTMGIRSIKLRNGGQLPFTLIFRLYKLMICAKNQKRNKGRIQHISYLHKTKIKTKTEVSNARYRYKESKICRMIHSAMTCSKHIEPHWDPGWYVPVWVKKISSTLLLSVCLDYFERYSILHCLEKYVLIVL